MAIRDLIPFYRRESSGIARREYDNPLQALQNELNRVFDDFWRGGELAPPTGAYTPRLDLNETAEAVELTAELPGLTQKDVELTLSSDGELLTLRGEKRLEREERREGAYLSERSYGSFSRTVELPAPVSEEQAEAQMKDGVLHVKMPKRKPEEGGRRSIPVS